ncbi:MAG: hypothetical protein ACFE85_19735 [Candidatus Hodarchaeota archaeon]
MSSGIVKNKKDLETEVNSDLELEYILAKALIPFSKFLDKKRGPDIYTGEENIPFQEMESEYKELLKAEFL